MRSDLTALYNQTDHQVDLNSQDFANVMAYLREHGLPNPQILEEEVGTPTGIRYRNVSLVYTDAMRPPLRMLAYLVMNRPQGAVVDYRMWLGETKVTIPEEYAPPKQEGPPQPPAKPTVLVGPQMYGSIYYPVALDDSRDGTEYKDGRGTFRKHMIPTPFGNSVYWEKTA